MTAIKTNFKVPIKGTAGKVAVVSTNTATAVAQAAAVAAQAAAVAAQKAVAAANAGTFSLANSTTDELNEGQENLYFTDARAAAAAPIQAIVPGAGVTVDTTNPTHPVISASAALGFDGGSFTDTYVGSPWAFDGGAF